MTLALSRGAPAAAAPARSRVALGVLCLVGGVAVFSVQDLILKLLSGAYPLHQAMVLRSLAAAPFLAALVLASGGLATLRTAGWRFMLMRGVANYFAYSLFYLGVAALPLATSVALFFSAPLFITILSVVWLRERVGPHRWGAVIVGFLGVLAMVRPGGALFDWAALFPVVAGLAYATSMTLARWRGGGETAPAMAFWANGVFLLGGLATAALLSGHAPTPDTHPSLAFLLRGWTWPTPGDLGLMLLCGPIAAVGLTLLVQAYRVAEANIVAPFEYTGLLWSVLFGWMVFGDWPDATAWGGIALIVGAGLYVLYRERVRARGGR